MVKKIKLIFLLSTFSVFGSSLAQSLTCPEILISPESNGSLRFENGEAIGELEVGSIGGVPVVVRDVTKFVDPVSPADKPDISIVSLNDVFENPPFMIGFGYPNAFLIHPTEDGNKRFAAKSLYRADSVVENLSSRQSVQNGLWVTLPGLSQEMKDKLLEEARKLEGTRRITCANASCEVLHNAGFTFGNDSPLYTPSNGRKLLPRGNDWPFMLLRKIAKHGLKYNGEKVTTDFIKVSPGFVENIFTGNFAASLKTPLRHGQRAFNGLKNKIPGLKYFLASKDGQLSVVAAGFDQVTRENVRLPEASLVGRNAYDFSITAPSQTGYLLRLFWGEHSIIQMEFGEKSQVKPEDHLSDVLKEYPDLVPEHIHFEANRKKRFVTALKRAAFNPGTIKTFHRFMSKGQQNLQGQSEKDIYDLLPLSTSETPAMMNLVITKKGIRIMHMKGFKKWADWFLTKHVLIANYADDVLFAGEIWKDADGNVYVNSNSGTYKPNAGQLIKALELLGDIFPSIPFVSGDS